MPETQEYFPGSYAACGSKNSPFIDPSNLVVLFESSAYGFETTAPRRVPANVVQCAAAMQPLMHQNVESQPCINSFLWVRFVNSMFKGVCMHVHIYYHYYYCYYYCYYYYIILYYIILCYITLYYVYIISYRIILYYNIYISLYHLSLSLYLSLSLSLYLSLSLSLCLSVSLSLSLSVSLCVSIHFLWEPCCSSS